MAARQRGLPLGTWTPGDRCMHACRHMRALRSARCGMERRHLRMTVWMGSASTSQAASRSAASLALSSCSLLMPARCSGSRLCNFVKMLLQKADSGLSATSSTAAQVLRLSAAAHPAGSPPATQRTAAEAGIAAANPQQNTRGRVEVHAPAECKKTKWQACMGGAWRADISATSAPHLAAWRSRQAASAPGRRPGS